MVNVAIKKLITYGIENELLDVLDKTYATNLILECMKLDAYEEPSEEYSDINLSEVLNVLLDDAVARGVIEDSITYKDLFDTKLMNCLMKRPSEVIKQFNALYEESPIKATDYFYKLSKASNYIREDRIKKDVKWEVDTEYGKLDITINLSKPEKDPKAIAAAGKAKSSSYPKCQLCMENEGYAGRVDHPARENHRIIPIKIQGNKWGFQYSPYVYFNEHCIVFNGEHTPMKIDHAAFCKLFDFISLFPHYSLGSNADLPIVGGSILSHDHFQGGNYEFPMARADYLVKMPIKGFEDVEAGILNWPMSVIRIRHKDSNRLIELADHILDKWINYTDEEAFIYAYTDGERHNTITPIVRTKDGLFEMDLTLRNNITTEEFPMGVYHPHQELHHIKKENIGLIEVMGLAILPARLKMEITGLLDAIKSGADIRADENLSKHADWIDDIKSRHEKIDEDILKQEIGLVFKKVLEDAGVYKLTDEGIAYFKRFVESL